MLDGQKTWTTRGAFCTHLFGLFRTDPDSARHKGLTYLLVPLDTPGITVRGFDRLDGDEGFAEVFFDDAFLDDDAIPGGVVLGQPEGGWAVAMATAGSERGLTLRSPGRFLATAESPWPPSYKRAILDSDGHDTELTEIPDIANGTVWPGAFDRARRNRLISDWAGRENELRRRRAEVAADIARARREDDAECGELNFGQSAGLIDGIDSCADVVHGLTAEAEEVLREAGRFLS